MLLAMKEHNVCSSMHRNSKVTVFAWLSAVSQLGHSPAFQRPALYKINSVDVWKEPPVADKFQQYLITSTLTLSKS
jgi:hypothetical protein